MILFTADWQVTSRNLDMIGRVEERIWELHNRTKIAALVHCGDVKHILNPIDGRVTNYLLDMVGRMRKTFRVLVLLGNHDKLSNQADAGNWFPVLDAAGAETFTEPAVVKVEDWRLHMLPYHSNLEQVKDWARGLRANANPNDSVLVMHETVVGAQLPGKSADSGLTLGDLHHQRYKVILGGHIHKPQRIGNLIYVGSPFAHDWGEVNQRKYFVSLREEPEQLGLDLPGYFDPSLKGYLPPKKSGYAGSIVRVNVSGPDELLPSLKEQAQRQGEQDYPGASIVVNVLRDGTSGGGTLKASRDDKVSITRWVKKAVIPLLESRREEIVSYLLFKLGEVPGGIRSGDGVTFLEATGRNVLSFEDVYQEYKTGLVVVRGQSSDWKNRSNGAGKTNFIQLVSLALTGRTLKGQEHDRWVRRGSCGDCWVRMSLKLPDGRTVKIDRQRKPKPWLKLWIDGEPYHAGAGPGPSQKALEELTGITAQTLANSIYLDQGAVNYMLTGTDGDRKALLEKFLNLERFQLAQKLIKDELKSVNLQRDQESSKMARHEEAGAALKRTLDGWTEPDLKQLKRNLDAATNALQKFKPYKRKPSDTKNLDAELEQVTTRLGELRGLTGPIEDRLARASKLGTICPRCGQTVSAKKKRELTQADEVELARYTQEAAVMRDKRKAILADLEEAEQYRKDEDRKFYQSKSEEARLENNVEKARIALSTGEEDAAKRGELQASLNAHREQYRIAKRALADAENEAVFLGFCSDAFSKTGIPAALMADACPVLTDAADYYSALICDSQIRVSFRLEGDSIKATVGNRWGGESLDDQSCGETRTASLIVSLALRETSAPCNLLIADEPGDGLDEVGAARLAQAFREVSDVFGCMYVISHNPSILAELEDYPQIVIEKNSGISKVVK